MKHFRRVLYSLFALTFILLFLPSAPSVHADTSWRWAQVDNGIPSFAYRSGAMMIQKDKITAISEIYGSLLFEGDKWSVNTEQSTFPRSDYIGNMFLDSRGIVYVGGVRADYNGLNTPYSYIFESSDGLNFSPVQPFIDINGGGFIWNFTEDKYGNVWAGENTSHTTATGAHLWRRRPNGVWTNVANWPNPENHIHDVYYDPYRDALYVAIGDLDHGLLKLPANKINSDGISASDFSFITPSFPDGTPLEVSAITSDADYLYVGMDIHRDAGTKTRALVRITDDNITQTLDVVYPLVGCTVWRWADVDDAGNIIFSGTGINEFDCTDNYVNQILVSDDHGTSWTMVKDFGSSSTSRGMEYTGLASHYATNWSGLYGDGNGWGGASMRAIIGRVIPTESTFYVDETNGTDWTNFGLSPSQPIKTLDYLELLDIQPGDSVQFLGNNTYTDPLMVGWSGDDTSSISLRGNTTTVLAGGNVSHPPAVAETFESAPDAWNFYLNPTGGSITADTSIVHGGSQSAKIVKTASDETIVSMRLKNVPLTDVHEGDTLYVDYWVYYPDDQTSDTDITMLRIWDNSFYEAVLRRYYQSGNNLLNEMVFNIPSWSSWKIPARHSLTSGTWHNIHIEDFLHSENGQFKLYVDGALWLNVNGLKTITGGNRLDAIYFYNFEDPITYYVDDFKFGKLPFESRGAINTNDYSSLDIGQFKIQGANGALISAGSTDIDLSNSIFDSVSVDAVINKALTNVNLYYNTIYNSGEYGVYSSGDATMTNNVVYNSGGHDIFIDGETRTIHGSYNWFGDDAAAGTGSYDDLGSTTFSGRDPAFVNPGMGDFHLRPIVSPLIDAGTDIPGFVVDFDGNLRPLGSAPDIGALENLFNNYMFMPIIFK